MRVKRLIADTLGYWPDTETVDLKLDVRTLSRETYEDGDNGLFVFVTDGDVQRVQATGSLVGPPAAQDAEWPPRLSVAGRELPPPERLS